MANRFALNQYQPLIPVNVNEDFEDVKLLAVEGDPSVFSTVFKTSIDGTSAVLRLRSLSDEDQTVNLQWMDREPSEVYLLDLSDDSLIQKIAGTVDVPARDFVSLKVIW